MGWLCGAGSSYRGACGTLSGKRKVRRLGLVDMTRTGDCEGTGRWGSCIVTGGGEAEEATTVGSLGGGVVVRGRWWKGFVVFGPAIGPAGGAR